MFMAALNPYESGVLREDVHGRLVADIDNIGRDASIQVRWIWTPLASAVPADVVDWVKHYRTNVANGASGLCLVGSKVVGIEDSMSAIAGALLRNFIRARVLTLTQLFEAVDDQDTPQVSCLLLPNFFISKSLGGNLPAWRSNMLMDVLLQRHQSGLQTVIYVSDMKALAAEYGPAAASLVTNHYRIVDL